MAKLVHVILPAMLLCFFEMPALPVGFGPASNCLAQETSESILWEDDEGQEDPELLAILDRLRSRPIDLNRADAEELSEFPFFPLAMAGTILQERSRGGPFRSWENLRKRLGLSKFEVNRLQPYFRLRNTKSSRSFSVMCRWTLQREFPLARGYSAGLYPGSPWKCTQRIQASGLRRFRMSFVLDKDPGEASWTDFAGFSMLLDKIMGMDRLCIGHLSVRSGQGLVFGNPLGMSSDPLAPVPVRPGSLSVSSSAIETGYPFGIGMSKSLGSWQAFVFVARLTRDASLHPDGSVKALDRSGYHRTENEISRKRNLVENRIGGRIETGSRLGRCGISLWTGRLTRRFGSGNGTEDVFDVFDFFGDRNTVWGADWTGGTPDWCVAGEWARSRSGKTAWVIQANARQRCLQFSLAWHRFDPGFHNEAAGWPGSGSVDNENGMTGILSHTPADGFRWSLAYRAFRRPWRTTTLPVPSEKDDWTMRFDAEQTDRKAVLLIRMRRSLDMTNGFSRTGQSVRLPRFRNRIQIKFDATHRFSDRFKHGMRLEWAGIRDPEMRGIQSSLSHLENGFLLLGRMEIRIFRRIFLSGQWTVFESESWDSRQTVWEDDVPGMFSIRSLYGRGTRWTILVRCEPVSGLRIHAKIGEERKEDVDGFGSGNDRTQGNTLRSLSLALEWNTPDRSRF